MKSLHTESYFRIYNFNKTIYIYIYILDKYYGLNVFFCGAYFHILSFFQRRRLREGY